jgi:hypothetical protein
MQLSDGRSGFLGEEMQTLGRDGHVQRDRWLRGAFDRLLRSVSEQERWQMVARIEALGQSVLQTDTEAPLRTFVAHFGSHPMADRVRLRLGQLLFESDQLLEAELVLKPLINSADPASAAPAVALTARLLERAGRYEESATWYRRLRDQYADVVSLNGKTGAEVCQSMPETSRVALALGARHSWPYGRVLVQQGQATSAARPSRGPFARPNLQQYPVEIRQTDRGLPKGVGLLLSSQLDSIGMVDPSGQLRHFVALERPDLRVSRLTRTGQGCFAKLYGHLVLVSLGGEILAIDAISPDAVGGMDVLWRANLGLQMPGVSSRSGRLQPKKSPMPWGGSREIATGRDGNPVGIIGTAVGPGVCYQVGRELRCVDPLSHRSLWVRRLGSNGFDLFGDDQFVFAVAPGSSTAIVYSRIDGQEVGERPVPSESSRWTTMGRQILAWERAPDVRRPIVVRLYDPWTGKDVWSHRFAGGSKGSLIQDEAVGVMQPDGQFLLVSLRDGSKLVDADLAPEPSLTNIHLCAGPDDYLLMTSGRFAATQGAMIVPGSVHSRPINGRVYAFDRVRGEPLWPVPATVENYGLPEGQPPGIPVLTFVRNVTTTTTNRRRQRATEVLCIDRRDGRNLLETKLSLSSVQSFQVQADLDQHEVTLRLNATSIRLQFTDRPWAPEPPAQTGHASSLAGQGHGNRLSELVGAMVGAIGKQTARMAVPVVEPQDKPAVDPNSAGQQNAQRDAGRDKDQDQ